MSQAPEPAAGDPLLRLKEHPEISLLIASADRVAEGLGYTEHGFRHANLVGSIAFNVLDRLGHDEHTAGLAGASGYLHDVGNMATRHNHPQTGAILVYTILRDEMQPEDLATIVGAVANHEEEDGARISPVSAAVILADKADVHRSRVRAKPGADADIHELVNYAAESSFLRVDSGAGTITLELTIDTKISQVMEYFEIFLQRMSMCRTAARTLGCSFKLNINGSELL
ncbi:MAG: HD domain-containing protein [Actinomycetota bacterium]